MTTIPQAVEEIDADWLRTSVRAEARAAFANLISVRPERLAEGIATSTEIYRLVLRYAPGATPGPTSLVAKLPSSSPAAREVARGWSTYLREVLFYREIAGTVRLRLPKTYVAEFEPETSLFALVMEDLSYAPDGDQVGGLPLDHVRLALDEIAGLHASWWNRPGLLDLESRIQPFGEGLWVGTGARHAAALPGFMAFAGPRASPELLRVSERMADALEPMMRRMAQTPRTLCHGDFRADNMKFAPGAKGSSLITMDWQAPMQARGAFDVGYLMSMSITTELRRAHETSLLRGYHDKLLAGGVQDYAYDAFFDDYRLGLLIGLTYPVQAIPSVDMTHPRTLALFDSAVRRMDACVQDHGLCEFVD